MSEFILHVDSAFESPYAMSVHVALDEKKVPFEVRRVRLGDGEHLTSAYGAVSLTQRVPTLTHGDFSLAESSAICEYLDDFVPTNPLYPADRRSRARARELQAWIRSDFTALRRERSTAVVFSGLPALALTADASAAARKLLDAADRLLPDRAEHLFGEWCIADLDLALMIQRLPLDDDGVPARLRAYADGQWRRASVRRWIELGRAVSR